MFQKFRCQTTWNVFDSFFHRLYSSDFLQSDTDFIGKELHELYLILFKQLQYSDWIAGDSNTPKAIVNLTIFSSSVSKWVKSLIFKEGDGSKRVVKLQLKRNSSEVKVF